MRKKNLLTKIVISLQMYYLGDLGILSQFAISGETFSNENQNFLVFCFVYFFRIHFHSWWRQTVMILHVHKYLVWYQSLRPWLHPGYTLVTAESVIKSKGGNHLVLILVTTKCTILVHSLVRLNLHENVKYLIYQFFFKLCIFNFVFKPLDDNGNRMFILFTKTIDIISIIITDCQAFRDLHIQTLNQ